MLNMVLWTRITPKIPPTTPGCQGTNMDYLECYGRRKAFKEGAFMLNGENFGQSEIMYWCPGPDSNRHETKSQGILSPWRLPDSATRARMDGLIRK